MANCNMVRIRDSKKYKVPKASNLAHNSAMTKATYWLHDGNDLVQSHKYENHSELNDDWNKWIDEAKLRYKNNKKNKRKLRSDAVVIEEGMIVIGTDVKATTEDITNIIKDFIKQFEEENNTKVRHWSYHNHEGHIDENNKSEKINRHIHFLFDNVSNDGIMIRRAWKREYLEKLQDKIFDISKKYIINIERAKPSVYKEVEIDGRKVKINTKKHQHHRIWRKEKELETQKNKKTDQDLDLIKDKQNKKDLAKQKDLKEEVTRLRAELKQNQAMRKDYARLEELNKDLQQQIKNKSLTILDLQDKIQKLERSIFDGKEEKENQNKSLQEQKKILEKQILELGKKINSNPIMRDYEEQIKEKQKQLDQYEETFEKLDDILLTKEDRTKGKEYLKRFEILERVSNLVKLVDKYKRAFDEFSKLLEKPKQTFNGIRLAIVDKLKQGEKSSNNLINKIVDQVKTLHEKKDLKTQVDQENELKKTKNSDSSFKKKRNK